MNRRSFFGFLGGALAACGIGRAARPEPELDSWRTAWRRSTFDPPVKHTLLDSGVLPPIKREYRRLTDEDCPVWIKSDYVSNVETAINVNGVVLWERPIAYRGSPKAPYVYFKSPPT